MLNNYSKQSASKRILFMNVVCGIGSTGRICTELAKEYEKDGYEVKIAYGREPVASEARAYAYRIGSNLDMRLHGVMTRLFDKHGLASIGATRRFIEWANEFDPDVLWLHNIHGYYINYELLFDWIKSRPDMEVRWTLHDCWSFTGHCSHYMMVGCEKWKCEDGEIKEPVCNKSVKNCGDCPLKKQYPASLFADNSCDNYRRKKSAFCGVSQMTIITPSRWLESQVKESFLKDYPTEVHYNRINTDIFKYTGSDFREKHGLENKYVILGVASDWSDKKGLGDFLALRTRLDESYVIVLVGLTPKQVSELSDIKGIISLEKTTNATELAKLYSMADLFFNPTHEDNYPTVNLEAEACDTPVLTYDTGGCRETISMEQSKVIEPDIDVALESVLDFKESARNS